MRQQFGLTMTVLIDPERRLARALDAPEYDCDIVLDRGDVIHFKGSSSRREVTEILDELLPTTAEPADAGG